MEPVAKRTRRQVEEKWNKHIRDRRNSVPVSNHPPASPTVIIIDDEDSEEVEISGSSSHTVCNRRVVKEEVVEDTPGSPESPSIVTLSSSTEPEEVGMKEEEICNVATISSGSEFVEFDMEEESDSSEVESDKDWILEKEKCLVVLDDSEDDTKIVHIDDKIDVVNDTKSSRNEQIDDDDDDDEDEDDDDEEEEESSVVRVKKAKRKRPLSDDEIHRLLFNSIMEVDNEMGNKSISLSEIDSEEEMDMEEPNQENELDSMYKLLDFCLACNDDSDSANPFLDEKYQDELCKEGEHFLILDEEIGIICKSCGIVREEIKHVMPPFHHNLFGDSDKRRYSINDHHHEGDTDLPLLEDDNNKDCKEDPNQDPTGTVWEIIPGMKNSLLPHQQEAFEFIWRNVAGGIKIDEVMSNGRYNGGGCLISHAPGTGKTRLAIAFLETYMKLFKDSRPVILAPASILLTWKKEFKKWKVEIPFQNLNDEDLSKEEIELASSIGIMPSTKLDLTTKRLIKLLFWKKNETVLIISYTMFTQLAGGESVKKKGRVKKDKKFSDSQTRDHSQMFRDLLLDLPGVVVLDEGHIPRNERSFLYKVLSDLRTRKRVLLSGTPFQNNFRELHNIFCLVRKEFLDNPFKSSVDEADGDKIKELKSKMEPFFHRYDGSILDSKVPGLKDNIVFLEPSELQKTLLKKVDQIKNHLEVNSCTALISVHPRLFNCKDKDFVFDQKWDLNEGAKTRFLIRLIQLSSALDERVLVFSEYIQPLNFVKAVLESNEYFRWSEGREILFMSGSHDMKSRKKSMDSFNSPRSEARVMLASIKACSEGIELTGASRVVLLDVTWNPAVERQAMCRAYRIGQGRVVHVYHLIMTDHDSNRHVTQTQKNKCSKYLFSSRKIEVGSSKAVVEDMILERLIEEKVVKEAMPWKACE